jgi:hypothetical protein
VGKLVERRLVAEAGGFLAGGEALGDGERGGEEDKTRCSKTPELLTAGVRDPHVGTSFFCSSRNSNGKFESHPRARRSCGRPYRMMRKKEAMWLI